MNILQVTGQPSMTDVVAVEAIASSYSLNELCGLSLLWLISRHCAQGLGFCYNSICVISLLKFVWNIF